MKTIIKLIGKDFIRFFKDKTAVLLTFAVPIVLILIFANIFGGGSTRSKIPIIVVNNSSSYVARYIENTIDSSRAVSPVKTYLDHNSNEQIKINEEKAKEFVREGVYSAALIIPEGFFTDTTTSLRFKFYFDPKSELETAIIQGEVQKTIMTQAGRLFPLLMQKKVGGIIGSSESKQFMDRFSELISAYFKVPVDSIKESFASIDSTSLFQGNSEGKNEGADFVSGMVQFENEQLVGKEISNPGLTRIVGGWAIMFLMFTITGAASSLFEEKTEGTMKRLLCMPVNRTQILWSKYIYTIVLGFIQLLVLFIFAWAFYKVDIFSNFLNLLIMITVSASAAVAFGMIITSLASSIAQANGYATLLILIMSALGGSWFPITFFPDWMQTIAKFTITYWSVEGFQQVLWRQSSITTILPHIGVLLGIAVIVNMISLNRFKKGKVF